MMIRAFILDMDGVLWRGQKQIGDLRAIFSTLQRKGLGVVMATNNASRSSEQHLGVVQSFGVENVDPWQIVSSSDAAAGYLKAKYNQGARVYVVGEPPLRSVLEKAGCEITDTNVDAVVAGIDRTITYEKLSKATRLIRKGAEFIGTNPDKTFPMPDGLAPGAGSILAAIEAATDVPPKIVGKPSPVMYEIAMQRLRTQPEETLVVGDRLETDIVGAQALGCKTALVLSGVTTWAQASAWRPSPDWILPDLTTVIEQAIGA